MRTASALSLALLPAALAVTGVDVSTSVSQSTWECLRQNNVVEFAMVRVYQSTGHTDPNGASTISAARAAGIKYVDGYIFPCYSCGDPAGQVRATVEHLQASGAKAGMLWYDVEPYHWSSSLSANQEFIKAMIDEGKALGVDAGVYSNWNGWSEIVGSDWTYGKDQGLPIWYAHYDGKASYSDFKSFGGWTSPSIKQYRGDKSACGAGVDFNWYPSAAAFEHQPRFTPPPLMPLPAATRYFSNASISASGCGWVAYKQCDSRWAGDPLGTSTTNTVCRAGCAMSSVAMYLSTRGHSETPGTLNSWLRDNGGYASRDLIVWASVNSFGVTYQGMETGVSADVLRSGLSQCHGIIANVRGGEHWVLLTGDAGNDNFYVNDPGFTQATYRYSEMLRFAVYH